MCYSGVALVTDYDAGLEGVDGIEPVTMEAVFAMLAGNVERTRELLLALIPAVPRPRPAGAEDARRPGPGSGRLPAGRLDQRVDEEEGADDQAVDRERGEGPGAEVAGQETDREVGREPGGDAAGQHLAADAVAQMPGEAGTLYTPAAKMIGVASRKANLRASSWSRPRTRPATMVMPERLMPANRASDWPAR